MDFNAGPGGEQVRKGVGLHPFHVFPEELWGPIGEKLEDSAEILRLIRAIPEIEGVLGARKRYWIFDQIVPHLSDWMKKRELLNCRQVCKQWSHAVDNFIGNHPAYRAYDHGRIVTGQIWVDADDALPAFTNYRRDPFTSWIDRRDQIPAVMEATGGHPEWRNPFVNRSLFLFSPSTEFWDEASQLIRKFGEHIWFLRMEDIGARDPSQKIRLAREWLDHLPNLKSLRLFVSVQNYLTPDSEDEESEDEEVEQEEEESSDSDPDSEEEEEGNDPEGKEDEEGNDPEEEEEEEEEEEIYPEDCLELWKGPLPPLPHLESLDLSNKLPSALVDSLFQAYSQQIRKLSVSEGHWKPEYSSGFPNLTQLEFHGFPSTLRMTNVLHSIKAPLLYTLTVRWREEETIELGRDIFPWLQRFKLIRNLTLYFYGGATIGEGAIFNPATHSIIPSLKFLSIQKDFLHSNSDFLLCFPNLEYLQVEPPTATGRAIMEGPPMEPTLRIWEAIGNLRLYEESNVWELLPKLRCMTCYLDADLWDQLGEEDDERRRFKRATYDYQRRMAEAN